MFSRKRHTNNTHTFVSLSVVITCCVHLGTLCAVALGPFLLCILWMTFRWSKGGRGLKEKRFEMARWLISIEKSSFFAFYIVWRQWRRGCVQRLCDHFPIGLKSRSRWLSTDTRFHVTSVATRSGRQDGGTTLLSYSYLDSTICGFLSRRDFYRCFLSLLSLTLYLPTLY